MLKNVISQGNFAIWPQISLVIFLLTFVAILCWVLAGKRKNHYDYMASLTLEEETPVAEKSNG